MYKKYTVDFHKVLEKFNLLPPTIEPTATGHIIEQIELTKDLIEKVWLMKATVLFILMSCLQRKGGNYGELSKRNIDELLPILVI